MIPVLFDNTKDLSSVNNSAVMYALGRGALTECISCTVTQSIDGQDEAQIVYPISGRLYDQLVLGCVVGLYREPGQDIQLYVVYKINLGLDGTATLLAYHVSYAIKYAPVRSGSWSFAGLQTEVRAAILPGQIQSADDVYQHNNFTLTLDGVTWPSGFSIATPASLNTVISMVIEQTGCVMEYDNFSVIFHASRGEDNGVTVRYGGNLTDAQQEYDTGDGFNAVLPYWVNSSSGAVYPASMDQFIVSQALPDGQSRFPGQYLQKIMPLDLSSAFETQPTTSELTDAAEAWLEDNAPWEPFNSMTINFVPFDPDANANQAAAQNLRLYDYVRVVISPTDTDVTARVVKTVYNVLLDRYDSVEIGQPQITLSDVYGHSGGTSGGGVAETFDNPVQFNNDVAVAAGKLLKVVTATGSVSLSTSTRGGAVIVSVDAGTGWTPLGIVGWNNSNVGTVFSRMYYAPDSNTARGYAYYLGTSSSAVSITITLYVLCVRTSL